MGTTKAPTCVWQENRDGFFGGGAVDVRVGSGHTRETCLQASWTDLIINILPNLLIIFLRMQTCIDMDDGRNGATLHSASGTCYCFKGVAQTTYSLGYEFINIDGCTWQFKIVKQNLYLIFSHVGCLFIINIFHVLIRLLHDFTCTALR